MKGLTNTWKFVLQQIIKRLVDGFIIIVAVVVTIQQFEGIIEKAIEKDTTEIRNEFQTEIKKLKTKDGAYSDFNIDPQLNNDAQTTINDTITQKNRGFLNKIFGSKQRKQ